MVDSGCYFMAQDSLLSHPQSPTSPEDTTLPPPHTPLPLPPTTGRASLVPTSHPLPLLGRRQFFPHCTLPQILSPRPQCFLPTWTALFYHRTALPYYLLQADLYNDWTLTRVLQWVGGGRRALLDSS